MQNLGRFLIALLSLLALPSVASAQDGAAVRSVAIERWVEEWDPATQRWLRVDTASGRGGVTAAQPAFGVTDKVITEFTYIDRNTPPATVYPVTMRPVETAIAQYGPFQVLDSNRAAIVGATGRSSPRHFDTMLRDFPELELLEFIEAPGTSDDLANLAVGRKIRAAGLTTHVPDGGSVRSGAVELFLAGSKRTMDNGAEFAVHSWLDNYGREPKDFAPDAPENRLYLDYYREMGMGAEHAREFYAMTNSVPHRSAKWLGAAEMRVWLRPKQPQLARKRAIDQHATAPHIAIWADNAVSQIRLARLDSSPAFP